MGAREEYLAGLAEKVIAGARTDYGQTEAGFDLYTAINGLGHPKFGYLAIQVYRLTSAPKGFDFEAETELREAQQAQLWIDLQPDLLAYVDRCCGQRYVSFSGDMDEGPIHYATATA